jgi:hypothetical protein
MMRITVTGVTALTAAPSLAGGSSLEAAIGVLCCVLSPKYRGTMP